MPGHEQQRPQRRADEPDEAPGPVPAAAATKEGLDDDIDSVLDEIDALQGTTLLSVLRQLRSGYPGRPRGFPWSLVLCGMRDVRDYALAALSTVAFGLV